LFDCTFSIWEQIFCDSPRPEGALEVRQLGLAKVPRSAALSAGVNDCQCASTLAHFKRFASGRTAVLPEDLTSILGGFTMATTETNLKEAFAGESQANRKYLAYAKKAEQEGFANVARLFRTAAEAETIHALGHLNALDGVKSTAENLKAAVEGETHEFNEMYPPMLLQAQADNHKGKRMIGFAAKAEAIHANLYRLALEAVSLGKDLSETNFFLCPVCGHIEMGKPPAACPICGAKGEKFVQV
jgi:rubrerythrin